MTITLPRVACRTLAIVALAATACDAASRGQRADDSRPPSATPVSEHWPTVELTLVVAERAKLGEPLPIAIRAENRGPATVEMYLRGRTVAFDILVTDSRDTPVWRRLEDEIIPAIVQLRTLAPGEAFELGTVWNQRTAEGRQAPAGDYFVRGFLLTDTPEAAATESVTLRLSPE
jgi:hypothetical protein